LCVVVTNNRSLAFEKLKRIVFGINGFAYHLLPVDFHCHYFDFGRFSLPPKAGLK
jgi:hypothetical protein